MIQHAYKSNSEAHWEYKQNNRISIICMISQQKTAHFADELGRCSQIHEVNAVNNYDSGFGSIVATMIADYNPEISNEEIKQTFIKL